MNKAFIVAIAITGLLTSCSRGPSRQQPTGKQSVVLDTPAPARQAAAKPAAVYPYSVVVGGVRSKEDVQAAMERDPAVAAHYADLKVDRLRPGYLTTAAVAYVSYRKDGKIYWMSRPVRLQAGERLLTDGENCVRGRCGNRIAWTPKNPVLEKQAEPAPEQFTTAVVRGQNIDEFPVTKILGSILPPATARSSGPEPMPMTMLNNSEPVVISRSMGDMGGGSGPSSSAGGGAMGGGGFGGGAFGGGAPMMLPSKESKGTPLVEANTEGAVAAVVVSYPASPLSPSTKSVVAMVPI